MRKAIALAIVPALIAGLFSVAPKIYELATQPRARLTYTSDLGLPVAADGRFIRTYSATIENSGRKPLTLLKIEITLDAGQIQNHSVRASPGLDVDARSGDQLLRVSAERLHEGDSVSLGLVIVADTAEIDPVFSARTIETVAEATEDRRNESDPQLILWGGLLSAASVFVMASLLLLRVLPARNLFGVVVGPTFKPDAIRYIFLRVANQGAFREAASRITSGTSYLEAGDMFYGIGSAGDAEARSRACAGLKCLLLVKDLADHSMTAILNSLKNLGSELNDADIEQLRARAVIIDDVVSFRQEVDVFVDEALSDARPPNQAGGTDG